MKIFKNLKRSKIVETCCITTNFLAFIFLGIILTKKFKIDLNFDLSNPIDFTICFLPLAMLLLNLFERLCFKKIEKNENTKDRSEYRSYLLEKLKIDNLSSVDGSTESVESNRDVIALMLKNNDETHDYFLISKKQAKSSYMFSTIACSIGILILVLSVILALVFQTIEPAIIAVISGAITELIAGTVLWVHNKSALQLNHYYAALHENEKFLASVNLVDKISEDKRNEAYFEIIKSQLNIQTKNSP